MNAPTPPGFMIEAARQAGPLAAGGYRVAVLEASGDVSVSDFEDLKKATAYADDAASEWQPGGPPIVYVFDDELQAVGRGRHYGEG